MVSSGSELKTKSGLITAKKKLTKRGKKGGGKREKWRFPAGLQKWFGIRPAKVSTKNQKKEKEERDQGTEGARDCQRNQE